MKQRTFLFIIVLLSTLTANAFDAIIDDIYYKFDASTQEAEVTIGTYTDSVTIPETVTYNGVTYSVTKIGRNAFFNCTSLTSVTIPNSVTSIGNRAFGQCTDLKSVTIPNSVRFIGKGAFCYCLGLTSVTIPNSVKSIENETFYGCFGLTSVTIPNSVKSIGERAFKDCSSLTSMTFPNSVTSIDNWALENCFGLKDIYCYAEIVPTTKSGTFSYVSVSGITLHVPAVSLETYKATAPWNTFGSIVAIEENNDKVYLPFVKEGKNWIVYRSDMESGCHREQYMFANEKVVKDGKTYMQLTRREDDQTAVYNTALLREEDRKVYYFDTSKQMEYLLFDYSLKVGDTYETYSRDEHEMVTYKVLSVNNYSGGPKVTSYVEDADSMTAQYRNLQKWTVCRIDNESFLKTWIESAGSVEGPLGNLYDIILPDMCRDYLAYVNDGEQYMAFSFYDTLNGLIHGCDLPTFSEYIGDYEPGHHQLTYELDGSRLHVYGEVFTQCGPNNYAYFFETPTDDPLVHMIQFVIQEVEPLMDCMALHSTSFYVPGFDPNMNYIIVDNYGEEHPVINKTPQMAYRPMVEEGKVWKAGAISAGNPVQMVDYYYLDGDTIINGKNCKQMMRQRYVNTDYAETNSIPQDYAESYEGAWYEEDKKVYEYDATNNQFKLMYDFSLNEYDTLQIGNNQYVVGPRQTGGLKGFKGVYRDVWMYADNAPIFSTPWLEGVGSLDGPTINVYPGYVDPAWVLMSCTVGDEVIYLNDNYEDGASLDAAGARKDRFDFTHTVKVEPKTPRRSQGQEPLYGEYNNLQLDIHLDLLDDAYLVCITDESGKAVYQKAINAGSIVGLNIDISAYTKGRYTVTVENSLETFTGEFEVQTTGIEEVTYNNKVKARTDIFNLQGQRISSLQKGLNIVNGRKVVIK